MSSLDNWDGSLSKAAEQKLARIIDLLDDSPGASTLDKTADKRINVPTIGIRHGWQGMVPSLDVHRMHDASNSNQSLSRNILVPGSPVFPMSPIVKSQSGFTNLSSPTRKTFSLTPLVSSPLHSPKNGLPSVTPASLHLTTPNSITSSHLDPLEIVSTYSADAEGEVVNEAEIQDVIVVHNMVVPHSALIGRTYHAQNLSNSGTPSHSSPLFTPPGEDMRSVDRLFTSCPSLKPSLAESSDIFQPRLRRIIMSHIQVPPLKRPRSDYQPFLASYSTIVSKRRVHLASARPRTLQEALQASIRHNANIGAPARDSLEKKKHELTQKKQNDRRKNIAVRPSVSHPPGAAVHVSRFEPDKAPGTKKKIKRSMNDDNGDDWGVPSRSKKRPRPISGPIVVDLTISDDEHEPSLPPPRARKKGSLSRQNPGPTMNPVPKPLLNPRLPKKTKFVHNSETDIVMLCFEDIRPIPLESLTFNTRFLRQSLANANKEITVLGPEDYKPSNCTWQNGSRPCLVPVTGYSFPTEDGIEETSVEGVIWESPGEKNEKEVIEISSESDGSVKKSIHRGNVDPPSPLPLPLHLARSPLKGQILDFGSDSPDGAIPSIKALGKRRAISPTRISTTPRRHPHSPVPSYSATSIRDVQFHCSSTSAPTHVVQNRDLNAFMYYPTAISPALPTSSSAQTDGIDSINPPSFSSSYNTLDTLASIFVQASSSQNQSEIHMGTFRHPSTHSHTSLEYNSQPQPQPGPRSRRESFFSSSDSLYDDVGFPGQHDYDHHYDHELQPQQQYDPSVDDPWSSALVSEDQYTYETIDPTLLGGEALLDEAKSEVNPGLDVGTDMNMCDAGLHAMGMELELETEFDDQVQQKDSGQPELGSGLCSSSFSSTDSSSSGPTQTKRTYSSLESVLLPDNRVLVDDNQGRKLPPRKRTKRILPDMISHDDIDLLLSYPGSKRGSLSSTANSASDADRSGSDSEPDRESDNEKHTIRKPVPKPRPQVSIKQPSARSISAAKKSTVPQVDQKQEWPLEDVDTYCHQCRRKTFYAKMTCSECRKKFCVRCYAFRYPECVFDVDDEEYSCPACEGFCNCTVCCRKRGEPYVGVRTCDKVPDSFSPSLQRPRNANVERVKLGNKTNLPPPMSTVQTTTIPEGVTQAWGSLYSVTGKKIGACFFDPSAEKDNSVVFAPVSTPIITTIAEVAQQAGTSALKDQPPLQVKIKMKRRTFIGMVQSCWGYTKPRVKLLKTEPYAKRSYDAMPRYYIGNKKYLFYPIEKDDESSLTPANESEAEEADRTDTQRKSFSPDSLEDGDVARAILLGLSACGVATVEVVPAT